MKSDPYNKRLYQLLISKGYKYTQHVRYDRYDNPEGITIFYYLNNYVMILEPNGEPMKAEKTKLIMEDTLI
jgi:hypothetical protein